MSIRKNVVLAALTICLWSANAAQASMITLSDVFDPLDVFFTGQSGVACTGSDGVVDTTSASACESLSWTQTLPDFGATDVLTSGTLTLTAYNDTSGNGQTFDLLIDVLTLGGMVTNVSTPGAPNIFGFIILSELDDGGIAVKLTSHNGNHTFYFAQSQLDAVVERLTDTGEIGPALLTTPSIESVVNPVVPEPGTLILVGFGLLGTSKAARRWSKKR